MDEKNRALLVIAVAITVFTAVFVSFGLPAFTSGIPEVTLPDVSQEGTVETGNGPLAVDVTPGTVQSIIATLVRPGSYYRELTVTLSWSQGTQSDTDTVQIWADGDYMKTAVNGGGAVQHRLIGDGTLYLWYAGDRSWREVPAQVISADLAQRIPTYEDVLALSPDRITATGYERKNGRDCIYVEVPNETLGSLDRYWIETATGLLAAAETWEEDRLVYEMTETTFRSPLEAGVTFALPDGTVLHETSALPVQEEDSGQGQQ